MDNTLGPFKWERVLVTCISKSIYGTTNIFDRGGIKPLQCRARKDTEPGLDLVQPGSMGRDVMKMNVRMLRQPPVMFGLMGVEVIKDNMQLFVRINSNGLVHKVQEFTAAGMA